MCDVTAVKVLIVTVAHSRLKPGEDSLRAGGGRGGRRGRPANAPCAPCESVLHFRKLSYRLRVEIVIRSSVRSHLITDEEARIVIASRTARWACSPASEHGAGAVHRASRRQPTVDQVIADLTDPNVAEVFHAMMLRSGLIARLGLDSLVDPDYGPQRA